MGARPMARVIQEHIKRPLADSLLFGKLAKGGEISIDASSDDAEALELTMIGPKQKALPKKSTKAIESKAKRNS